jgi:hypothetical protein
MINSPAGMYAIFIPSFSRTRRSPGARVGVGEGSGVLVGKEVAVGSAVGGIVGTGVADGEQPAIINTQIIMKNNIEIVFIFLSVV